MKTASEAREKTDQNILNKVDRLIEEAISSGKDCAFLRDVSLNERTKKILIDKGYKIEYCMNGTPRVEW